VKKQSGIDMLGPLLPVAEEEVGCHDPELHGTTLHARAQRCQTLTSASDLQHSHGYHRLIPPRALSTRVATFLVAALGVGIGGVRVSTIPVLPSGEAETEFRPHRRLRVVRLAKGLGRF
jgi:hypothetical protein